MIPELGHFALILALPAWPWCRACCRCSARTAASATGWRWRGPPRRRMFLLVAVAFGCLTYASSSTTSR